MEHMLIDKTYDLIDELAKIAQAHDSTVARVAIAWLVQKPGVTSTLIGARRIPQLEDNLKALDVKLTPADIAKLDALTKPTFGFPQSMEPYFPAIHNGGTTVNGVAAAPSPFVMEKGGKPY
jgi:diketogulonate reductase-like aldo/keto reductase